MCLFIMYHFRPEVKILFQRDIKILKYISIYFMKQGNVIILLKKF